MYLQEIIEVAMGVIFAWLLISLATMQVQEIVARVLNKRALQLEKAIGNLLVDEDLKKKFYKHPLIESLKEPLEDKAATLMDELCEKKELSLIENWKKTRKSNLPSYIPPEMFANALFDIITHAGTKESEIASVLDSTLVVDIDTGIKNLLADPKTEKLGLSLRSLFAGLQKDAKNLDSILARGRKNVESWFDSSMDRLSGWYKRWAQKVAFVVALIIAIAFNIDSIYMAQELWRNPAMREATSAYITDYVNEKSESETTLGESDLRTIRADLQTLAFPSGWTQIGYEKEVSNKAGWSGFIFWSLKAIGWAITAAAAMQGAPFWFDILKKLINVRSTGVNPKEKKTAAVG